MRFVLSTLILILVGLKSNIASAGCVAIAVDSEKRVIGYPENVELTALMARDEALKQCHIKAGSNSNCVYLALACNEYLAVYAVDTPERRTYFFSQSPDMQMAVNQAYRICVGIKKGSNAPADVPCTQQVILQGTGRSVFEWYYGITLPQGTGNGVVYPLL